MRPRRDRPRRSAAPPFRRAPRRTPPARADPGTGRSIRASVSAYRPPVPISVSRPGRRLGEDLCDRVPDLVDLPERGQEVDGSRLLAVIELLAVDVHLEPTLLGRRERDR